MLFELDELRQMSQMCLKEKIDESAHIIFIDITDYIVGGNVFYTLLLLWEIVLRLFILPLANNRLLLLSEHNN